MANSQLSEHDNSRSHFGEFIVGIVTIVFIVLTP
jgi:hypothetical protein